GGMGVVSWLVTELMSAMPGMVENCFSSVGATAEAMVSGLARGSSALTWMVGKSTVGSVDTGSSRYAAMPKIRMPAMTSTVMTGRRIQISQKFTQARPESC